MEKEILENKFRDLTSKITSFSHAYLFSVDSIEGAIPLVKNFAKRIICKKYNDGDNKCDECNICYLIDNGYFDDLYVINPDTIGIKNDDIEELFKYFKTKSLRENGCRVYIICGMERLNSNISNKILKFLEEPEENIYALLITENIANLLPTIVSRCQVLKIKTEKQSFINSDIENMHKFLGKVINDNTETIAYIGLYWRDYMGNREKFHDLFTIIEDILTNELNSRYKLDNNIPNENNFLEMVNEEELIQMIDITSNMQLLIKKNINLNLLLDRYIMDLVRCSICKE